MRPAQKLPVPVPFLRLRGKQLVNGRRSGPPLPRHGFFTVSGRLTGLTNADGDPPEHDFLQNRAVLSPNRGSTTFRDLETGEKPCKSATVSLRRSAIRR